MKRFGGILTVAALLLAAGACGGNSPGEEPAATATAASPSVTTTPPATPAGTPQPAATPSPGVAQTPSPSPAPADTATATATQATVPTATAVPPTASPTPPPPTPTTPSLPPQATINLAAQTFSPASATIAAGGTVTWSWAGDMVHNIVSDGPQSFPGHPEFQTEGTYAFTFTQPGTYNFHCEVHPNMRGTITVQ